MEKQNNSFLMPPANTRFNESVKNILSDIYSTDNCKLTAFQSQTETWYFQFTISKSLVAFVNAPFRCFLGTVEFTKDSIKFNAFLLHKEAEQFIKYYTEKTAFNQTEIKIMKEE